MSEPSVRERLRRIAARTLPPPIERLFEPPAPSAKRRIEPRMSVAAVPKPAVPKPRKVSPQTIRRAERIAALMGRTCAHPDCTNELQLRPGLSLSDYAKRMFCSRSCSLGSRRKPLPAELRHCERGDCRKPLLIRDGERPANFRKRRFCSVSCSVAARALVARSDDTLPPTKICICGCGGILTRKPREEPAKWRGRCVVTHRCSGIISAQRRRERAKLSPVP